MVLQFWVVAGFSILAQLLSLVFTEEVALPSRHTTLLDCTPPPQVTLHFLKGLGFQKYFDTA
jgi:hypothetical protein